MLITTVGSPLLTRRKELRFKIILRYMHDNYFCCEILGEAVVYTYLEFLLRYIKSHLLFVNKISSFFTISLITQFHSNIVINHDPCGIHNTYSSESYGFI